METIYAGEHECGKCYEADVGEEELRQLAHEGIAASSAGGGYAHVFGNLWFYKGKKMSCSIFNACHPNSQPGTCDEFHAECPNGELAVQLLPQVEHAVATRDVHAIQSMIEDRGDMMGIDRFTGEIVFVSCEAQIAHRVAVPQDILAAL